MVEAVFPGQLPAHWRTVMFINPSIFAWRLNALLPNNLAEHVLSFINHDFIFIMLEEVTVDRYAILNRSEVRVGTEHMMHTSFLIGVAGDRRVHSVALAWSPPTYFGEIECNQSTACLLERIFATMKKAIEFHDGTAMTLYSRLDPAADQPAHYQGFGITAKLQCILYRAPEDVDECDSLTLQLGQTQAWYDEIPTLHAGIAKTGELQWVHRLHHREDGQRQTEELLLSQLGNPLGLSGRAELVDAFAENPYDWINFNFKLALRCKQ